LVKIDLLVGFGFFFFIVVYCGGLTPFLGPEGWPVRAHGGVAPLEKDYGHLLQGAPCPEP
jgi:hypothetical protein